MGSIVSSMFLLLLSVVSLKLLIAVVQALHDGLSNHEPLSELLLIELIQCRVVSTDSPSLVLAKERGLCVVEPMLRCRCTNCRWSESSQLGLVRLESEAIAL
jgi:hypothetical protein